TLLMYVNAPFQAWQGQPSFLTARIVAVVLSLGAIAAAWWLGRRAYGTGVVPAAVVAVCTIEVAYSRAAVTDVPLTLAVGVALALMVSGRIELAGLAVGFATGFKYPGVFLIVPLVVAGWERRRRLALGVLLAIVAFFASSPFVLVRRRLLPRPADAARALRPLRAAARAAARRARGPVPLVGARHLAAAGRPAHMVDPRHEAVDAHRHAHRRAALGRLSPLGADARRRGPVDAALPDARRPAPAAARAEADVRPEPERRPAEA